MKISEKGETVGVFLILLQIIRRAEAVSCASARRVSIFLSVGNFGYLAVRRNLEVHVIVVEVNYVILLAG